MTMVVLMGLSFTSWGMICNGMSCCEEDLSPSAAINCCQPQDQARASVAAVKIDAPSFDFLPVIRHEELAVVGMLTPGYALHSGHGFKINSPPVFLLKSAFLI